MDTMMDTTMDTSKNHIFGLHTLKECFYIKRLFIARMQNMQFLLVSIVVSIVVSIECPSCVHRSVHRCIIHLLDLGVGWRRGKYPVGLLWNLLGHNHLILSMCGKCIWHMHGERLFSVLPCMGLCHCDAPWPKRGDVKASGHRRAQEEGPIAATRR
jgi:hypothetical protein